MSRRIALALFAALLAATFAVFAIPPLREAVTPAFAVRPEPAVPVLAPAPAPEPRPEPKPEPKAKPPAAPAGELRGAWVVSWRNLTSQEQVDQVIRRAKALNLNALFVQVRASGDAYYASAIVPRAEALEKAPPDFDPLAAVIRAARQENIKVHAWLNTLLLWRTEKPPKDSRHAFNAHPDWLMRERGGKVAFGTARDPQPGLSEPYYWLSPGIPAVQDHLFQVFMEVVEKYDIDGIHLDYVRFPARTGRAQPVSYDPVSLQRFRAEAGQEPEEFSPAWDQWRAAQVTAVVSRIYKGVKERKPHVEVSAATMTPWELALGRVFSDGRKWLEIGILDFIVPMSYTTDPFVVWKNTVAAAEAGGPGRVAVGLASYLTQPEELARQIEVVRREKARGFVLFALDDEGMPPGAAGYVEKLRPLAMPGAEPYPALAAERPAVAAAVSDREVLRVRLGDVGPAAWPSFKTPFWTRSGRTTLVIENKGLERLSLRIDGGPPIEVDPAQASFDLGAHLDLGESKKTDPRTFVLEARGEGPPGSFAALYLLDRYR